MVKSMHVSFSRMPSGLRLVHQQNAAAPVVAIQVWVGIGSADESERVAGIAHVVEHMAFKGSKSLAVGEFSREIEGAGGAVNAWTSFDETVYHVVVASRFFERAIGALADTVLNPILDADELSREIGVVLEELRDGDDSPDRVLTRELFKSAYRPSPYARPVIGYLESVRALRRRDLVDFVRRYYRPQNMTLVVVGDVEHAVAERQARRLFGGKSSKSSKSVALPARTERAVQRSARLLVQKSEDKEAHFALAFPLPGFVDDATAGIDVLSIILGQGNASRLIRHIRHDKQLASRIYCYAYTPKSAGLLTVGGSTHPAKLVRALPETIKTLLDVSENGVTQAELERAQAVIESDSIYQRETVEGQARKLGYYCAITGSPDYERKYIRQVRSLAVDDVKEIAQRFISERGSNLVVLTPRPADEQRIAKAVAAAWSKPKRSRVIVSRKTPELISTRLSSGGRVVVLRDSSVPLVAAQLVWLGGVLHETRANNGISRAVGALMTRGTQQRTADEIHEQIETMAGTISGFSGRNSLGLRMEVISRHSDAALETLLECALAPAFIEREVSRYKKDALEEIRTREDEPGVVGMDLFLSALYGNHPYAMPEVGNASSVRRNDRKAIAAFHRAHCRADNMVLSIAGDVDPDRVIAQLEQMPYRAPRGKRSAPLPKAPRLIDQPVSLYQRTHKEQTYILYGFPGIEANSPKRYAVELLVGVLGGMSGRLFDDLREQRGLAYHVDVLSVEGRIPGYFVACVVTSPDKTQAVVEGLERQLKLIAAQPPSKAELDRVKRYTIGAYAISLQRKSQLSAHVAFNTLYQLGERAHLQTAEALQRQKPADIQRVARQLLDPNRRVLAIVSPRK
ncbi:MAG: insulinase family protein [Deltaproteobacteria bacterium]|nr:insulinase family protein [Deltaproteobacteria bacterium]